MGTIPILVLIAPYLKTTSRVLRGTVYVCPVKNADIFPYIRRKVRNGYNSVKVLEAGGDEADFMSTANISRSFCISKPECYFANSGIYHFEGKICFNIR